MLVLLVVAAGFYAVESSRTVSRELRTPSGTPFSAMLHQKYSTRAKTTHARDSGQKLTNTTYAHEYSKARDSEQTLTRTAEARNG